MPKKELSMKILYLMLSFSAGLYAGNITFINKTSQPLDFFLTWRNFDVFDTEFVRLKSGESHEAYWRDFVDFGVLPKLQAIKGYPLEQWKYHPENWKNYNKMHIPGSDLPAVDERVYEILKKSRKPVEHLVVSFEPENSLGVQEVKRKI
jgi:hypothetical protein